MCVWWRRRPYRSALIFLHTGIYVYHFTHNKSYTVEHNFICGLLTLSLLLVVLDNE
jgi:hypothetical protein